MPSFAAAAGLVVLAIIVLMILDSVSKWALRARGQGCAGAARPPAAWLVLLALAMVTGLWRLAEGANVVAFLNGVAGAGWVQVLRLAGPALLAALCAFLAVRLFALARRPAGLALGLVLMLYATAGHEVLRAPLTGTAGQSWEMWVFCALGAAGVLIPLVSARTRALFGFGARN